MTNQEATERMAALMLSKLSEEDAKRAFKCKRELRRVMANCGKVGLLAFGALSVELLAERQGAEIKIDQVDDQEDPPVIPVTEHPTDTARNEKAARVNLRAGGFTDDEIESCFRIESKTTFHGVPCLEEKSKTRQPLNLLLSVNQSTLRCLQQEPWNF